MSHLKNVLLAMASAGLLVTAAPAFSQSTPAATDSGSVPSKTTREDRLERQGRMDQKAKRQTANPGANVATETSGGKPAADTRKDKLVRQGRDASNKPDRTPAPNPSVNTDTGKK